MRVLDPPAGTTAGRNATLQISYTADFGAPHNQTFYACADITYVDNPNFKMPVPCSNTTRLGLDDVDDGKDNDGDGLIDEEDEDIDDDQDDDGKDGEDDDGDGLIDEADEAEKGEKKDENDKDGKPTGTGALGVPATHLPDNDKDDGPERKESSEKSGGGMSRGEIAGTAAGTVSGVVLLGAVGLLWYRWKEQKKRRIRLARMEQNARLAGHIRGGSTAKEGVV